MKAVAEAAWFQAPAPQVQRPGAGDRRTDFSTYVSRAQQGAGRAADVSASDERPSDRDATTAEANATDQQQATADDPAKADEAAQAQAQAENAAWLAAQMLAYKLKLPMQQGAGEGTSEAPIQTTVVTLPASYAAAGLAPPAPGTASALDEAALRAMAAGQAPEIPAAQQPPASPAAPLPLEPAAVDPTTQVDPGQVDPLPATPVVDAADPSTTAPTPEVIEPSTPVATDTPATDPVVTVGATEPDPAPLPVAEDPAVTPTDPVVVAAADPDPGPAPVDGDPQIVTSPSDPQSDDGSTPAATGTGNGATISAGRASAQSAGTGHSSAGHSGAGLSGGSDGQSSAEPKPNEKTAGVNMMTTQAAASAALMAPAQSQLAVPADNQLAPTLGVEISSTAQGMSALDRVLQATDQAQTATPMLKVLNVQLAPPDLGNVSVRLSLEGSAIEVRMAADQGRTRTLLERDRHIIADSLTKVGYSVSTLTVEQASSTGDSNMSSAGQSFSSNQSFDGSSGRQSNGAGGFGRSQSESGRWTNFMDGDGGTSAPAPGVAPRGVFI